LNLSIQHIAKILTSKNIEERVRDEIQHISIDSRSLENSSKTLFFALKGPNNDGHKHIIELIDKGVRNFVVSYIPPNALGKSNFIEVENTLVALQNLAAHYRASFSFPVIGITGSNGKTIVKEWLNFLLNPEYNVVRSPKSYNSQVGVPLSLFTINESNNFGIFEAGISRTNEMVHLQKMIRPTIGILTNIGSAHDEGFKNQEEKLQEKLKLFKGAEILICSKDSKIEGLKDLKPVLFTFSFTDKNADVFITKTSNLNSTVLEIKNKKQSFQVKIPFQDAASIENAIHCLMVLLYLNYDINSIQERLMQLFSVEMRLQLKSGINNTSVIDDSYSSDFQSLKIALDFLENQKQHQKKTLILSDIFQSKLENDALYEKVATLVTANKIDRFIGIGSTISQFSSLFSNGVFYENTTRFLEQFSSQDYKNETILIKGARSFEFEKIVSLLEEKNHETVLEINLNAISHNLNYYKSKLQPTTKVMVMVKAFGYGNGGFEIAKLLEHHKIDYLGVAFADEGITLKMLGIQLPIMVLNPETSSFESIIQHNLEPEIYSIKGLNAFLTLAKAKNLFEFPIHLKIDTGMHRLGFEEDTLSECLVILKNTQLVKVKSILSHLATSDDLKNKEFGNHQIALFEKLSNKVINELKINPIRHILNSSGISNFPHAQYNMVRLGIGLYGISNDENEQPFLENVGTLKSVISQIRTIQKGESVGYSRRFIASKETIIATIPIGYADGISRSWGNGLGFVTINNKKATIVGSICMDMLMVDVTDIDCMEGDRVVIFGQNPTVNFIAKSLNTISYEVLTSISQRVKRVFFRE
jgi:Alr-MurF fusion protein